MKRILNSKDRFQSILELRDELLTNHQTIRLKYFQNTLLQSLFANAFLPNRRKEQTEKDLKSATDTLSFYYTAICKRH